jgi:tetratricopeptide (TPR) repeat protein
LFALLPLALLLSFGGQNDPQSAGLQALDHQDYEQAEHIFSKLAAADSKDYSALFNLALAETGLKKPDAAAEHYKQVLALKPGLYEAELNLGILYLREHRAADALPLLRDATKQKPQQARAQRYLGDSLLATGDFAGAADAYRAALAADPKMAAAELGLGQSLLRRDKLEEASPHYRQAAALDPNLKSYELELAVALSNSNRDEDAIALLKEFPNDPGACEELGRLDLKTSRPAEAVAAFKAAVDLSPTPANRLALATAYLKNNQPDPAAPILEQALAANPNDYDLRMAIGRIHRDKRNKQDYAAAANQFLAAANLKPDSVEAWNEAASALVLAELYPQALAALDKIHSLNADSAGDYYYRAIVLDKLHQVKPALASYQRFLAMSGGKFPDQEFIARQRSRILEKEANR